MIESTLLDRWADAEADEIEELKEDAYYLHDSTSEKAGKIADRIYSRNLRNITRLVLRNSDITDDAVALISNIRWLQHLNLLGNQVTNHGIQFIANGLKELRSLNICSNEGITDIKPLFGLKNLGHLLASHTNVRLTPQDVTDYLEKSNLKTINLDGAKVEPGILREIETLLRNRENREDVENIESPGERRSEAEEEIPDRQFPIPDDVQTIRDPTSSQHPEIIPGERRSEAEEEALHRQFPIPDDVQTIRDPTSSQHPEIIPGERSNEGSFHSNISNPAEQSQRSEAEEEVPHHVPIPDDVQTIRDPTPSQYPTEHYASHLQAGTQTSRVPSFNQTQDSRNCLGWKCNLV